MNTKTKIRTIIIDDDPNAIESLQQALMAFDQVQIIETASSVTKATKIILGLRPDLVFLDVEMPQKNGFELLRDLQSKIEKPFETIFCTAYEKYTLQALRESALDFILKPVTHEEIKNALDRFTQRINKTQNTVREKPRLLLSADNIALPTLTGIRFAKKGDIILITHEKEKGWAKSFWYVTFFNGEKIRLKAGINSVYILDALGEADFLQINQSTIVNCNFIKSIETKLRKCVLIPPYEHINLCVSRGFMEEIRNKIDLF